MKKTRPLRLLDYQLPGYGTGANSPPEKIAQVLGAWMKIFNFIIITAVKVGHSYKIAFV